MDRMWVIRHRFGVLIILNKLYIYFIMDKTPFQKFIDHLQKDQSTDQNLLELAKKFQNDEKNHINRIYETGVFHGETKKPKKFDFYSRNFDNNLGRFISNF